MSKIALEKLKESTNLLRVLVYSNLLPEKDIETLNKQIILNDDVISLEENK